MEEKSVLGDEPVQVNDQGVGLSSRSSVLEASENKTSVAALARIFGGTPTSWRAKKRNRTSTEWARTRAMCPGEIQVACVSFMGTSRTRKLELEPTAVGFETPLEF